MRQRHVLAAALAACLLGTSGAGMAQERDHFSHSGTASTSHSQTLTAPERTRSVRQPDAHSVLESLKSLDQEGLRSLSDTQDNIRLRAMRDAALVAGSQKGYATRMAQFQAELERSGRLLETIFNFRALMQVSRTDATELYVQPPVIQEARNAFAVEDDGSVLKVSGRVYRIVEHARLVSAPKTWREYLFSAADEGFNPPHGDLLPKNKEERGLWSNWVEEGWFEGVELAHAEMNARIRVMGRDMKGMIDYMVLAERGLVSEPQVAIANAAVSGGGDEMHLRESIYRMVEPARLENDQRQWQPINTGRPRRTFP